MTRRAVIRVAVLAAALFCGARGSRAAAGAAASSPPAAAPGPVAIERHHYMMSARVRPLLLFWIGRANVGDAQCDPLTAA